MSRGAFLIASVAVLGAVFGLIAAVQYNQSLTSLAQVSANEQAVKDLWLHWKLAFGKLYLSDSEESIRFEAFKGNYDFIQKWNAEPEQTSQVGLNQYADLAQYEFSEKMGCLLVTLNSTEEVLSVEEEATVEDLEALPASVDWVTAGAVTPIKNQGQCGSCWAFSTTGSLEGCNYLFNGKNLLSFSEQQLVDCSQSYGNQGCNGGLMDYAFKYVMAKGIELESQYPYTAADGKCKYAAADVKFKNSNYKDVTKNNEVALATAVAQQPVSIAIEADQSVFQLYTSGIITSKTCGTALDHGVLAVGYNTQGSQPYWIVKNSWGASWGNKGYVWIAKSSSTSTPGICGIAMEPSYPTFSK